mgnify:CR=1 FL=1
MELLSSQPSGASTEASCDACLVGNDDLGLAWSEAVDNAGKEVPSFGSHRDFLENREEEEVPEHPNQAQVPSTEEVEEDARSPNNQEGVFEEASSRADDLHSRHCKVVTLSRDGAHMARASHSRLIEEEEVVVVDLLKVAIL